MYAGAFNRGGQCWRRVEGAYRNLVFTVYKRCSVSADPKVRRRLVPSKCFSPCLLCCVCWPRNWDLLRSLWLSRSVSCWKDKERKKRVTQESNQNHPILFLRSQCLLLQNWLNAPTTSVLRSSVWGQLEITTISRWRSRSNAPAMMSNMLRPAGKVTICFIFLRVRLTERETDALSVQTASI